MTRQKWALEKTCNHPLGKCTFSTAVPYRLWRSSYQAEQSCFDVSPDINGASRFTFANPDAPIIDDQETRNFVVFSSRIVSDPSEFRVVIRPTILYSPGCRLLSRADGTPQIPVPGDKRMESATFKIS
jgi:hypothetical protein